MKLEEIHYSHCATTNQVPFPCDCSANDDYGKRIAELESQLLSANKRIESISSHHTARYVVEQQSKIDRLEAELLSAQQELNEARRELVSAQERIKQLEEEVASTQYPNVPYAGEI